jgi:cell division septation protein DedD
MRLVFTILDIALAVVYLPIWAFGLVTGKTITLAGGL